MLGKVVVFVCLGTLTAGAETIVFQGCDSTPNKYFTFTKLNGNNNHIAKVSLKKHIPTDALGNVTLLIPGSYERKGQQYQVYIGEKAFSKVRDNRNIRYDKKRLDITLKFVKNYGHFVKMTSNCKEMFADSDFVKIDFAGIDETAKITNTQMMFWLCNRLRKINFGNLDTSNVTNMQSMFQYCCSLKELDLSKFDTRKVTDMSLLFMECNKLEDLDITSFDTSSVTTMQSMFNGCNSIQRLDLSNFNTKNVQKMLYMFDKCENLKKVNLTSFNTEIVSDMCYMFRGCSKLKQLDLSSFDMRDVLYYGDMFESCSNLVVKEPCCMTLQQRKYIQSLS